MKGKKEQSNFQNKVYENFILLEQRFEFSKTVLSLLSRYL